MENKIKQLISKWDKEQKVAQKAVQEATKKHKYGEAHEQQIKSVWIENCILDLKDLL